MLNRNAQRVQEFLNYKSLNKWQVIEKNNTTATSNDAASTLGCEPGQIAKSIIFKTKDKQPILVIASGINKIDTKALRPEVGNISIGDSQFTENETSYLPGGIPPIAHYKGDQPVTLKTFIDRDLLSYSSIWAAAGTTNSVFELDPNDLTDLTNGKVMDLKLSPK